MSLLERVKPGISRRVDFALHHTKCVLLIIDIQKCFTYPEHEYYTKAALPRSLKNIEELKAQFHAARDLPNCTSGCEVIFTYVQSSTKDGRDVSLDYKLSGPMLANIPRVGDTDIFLKDCMPDPNTGKGDILLPKTSCSVFQSTNLDYMLRNLGIEQIVVCGQLTDVCVKSTVRDGAALGYLMTVPEDACAAMSPERNKVGLQGMQGFCRILKTSHIISEIAESVDTHQTENISLESLTTFLNGKGYPEVAIEVASTYLNSMPSNGKKSSPQYSQQNDDLSADESNEDHVTASSVVADNIHHQEKQRENNTTNSDQHNSSENLHVTTSPTSNYQVVNDNMNNNESELITATISIAVLPVYNINNEKCCDAPELATTDSSKQGLDTTTMAAKINNLSGPQYQQQMMNENLESNNDNNSNINTSSSTSITNTSSQGSIQQNSTGSSSSSSSKISTMMVLFENLSAVIVSCFFFPSLIENGHNKLKFFFTQLRNKNYNINGVWSWYVDTLKQFRLPHNSTWYQYCSLEYWKGINRLRKLYSTSRKLLRTP